MTAAEIAQWNARIDHDISVIFWCAAIVIALVLTAAIYVWRVKQGNVSLCLPSLPPPPPPFCGRR